MDIGKRFQRIVSIYFQLQSRSTVKASDLAEHFDVSLRTIYRDMHVLNRVGIPICGEAGTGYFLMEGYKLPALRFTREEVLSLAAALKLMHKFVDKSLFGHYSSAMSKIRTNLRHHDKEHIQLLEDNMQMQASSILFNANTPEALTILSESVASLKQVSMDYLAAGQELASKRRVEPVGLFHEGFWYLFAYCHLREDYRQFRLDRIQAINSTDHPFSRKHRALAYYLSKREAPPTSLVRIAVRKAAADHLHWERNYYGFESEETDGEWVRMNFQSRDVDNEFARWFLMFADQACVLEPDSLKIRLKELIASIVIDHPEFTGR